MDFIQSIKNNIMMKIEDPFWNDSFSQNLPKWIHIWISSIGLGTGIFFIVNKELPFILFQNIQINQSI